MRMSAVFTVTDFLLISRALEHIIQEHELSRKLIKDELKKKFALKI